MINYQKLLDSLVLRPIFVVTLKNIGIQNHCYFQIRYIKLYVYVIEFYENIKDSFNGISIF